MTSDITITDRDRIFDELALLIHHNSVHGDETLIDACSAAADTVAHLLDAHGLTVETHDTVDGSTAVIGRKPAVGNAPTVLLYSHYDVVPAGNPADWVSDAFTLTERDGRWYGRGAADCKGQFVMHLAALRAVHAAGGTDVGLIVLVEGSEENGGVGLEKLIEEKPELFAADAILIADTGNVAVGKPTLTTSLRGGVQLTVTVDTLRAPAHSGSFGGAAPDAVAALMRALDSLRDDSGVTRIDGVDSTGTWDGEPYDPEVFRADAGVLDGVSLLGGDTATPADQLWVQPAITVTGFSSTPVDQAVNAVPATAQARINLRVPHGMDPRATGEKVVEHLARHVPWGARIETTIDEVNPTFATDTSQPAIQLLGETLKQAYGVDNLAEAGAGGSIPLTAALQEAFPDAAIALYGVSEPQCTIHSPNESVDPTEIERIAAAEAMFLLRYGQ